MVNQVELHPLNTLEKNGLITYLKSINCVPIAYSSLAPSSEWRKMQPGRHTKDTENSEHSSHMDVLKELTIKYNVNDGTLLLRWAIQHGYPFYKELPKAHFEQHHILSSWISALRIYNEWTKWTSASLCLANRKSHGCALTSLIRLCAVGNLRIDVL